VRSRCPLLQPDPAQIVAAGTAPNVALDWALALGHVGNYAGIQGGQTVMVDAPHSGAEIRVEPFPDVVGQSWSTERYVGATSP
jgi:hypothetical protein